MKSDMCLDFGYDYLASLYSFSTSTAMSPSFGGFDTHECNEFILDFLRLILIEELYTWFKSNPEDK
jgi:hypothetical protein